MSQKKQTNKKTEEKKPKASRGKDVIHMGDHRKEVIGK